MRVPVNISSLNLSLFLAFPLYSNVDSGRFWFVVQNRIISPQNGNLLEKLSSWTEESFIPCLMTLFATQFWSFAQILCCAVCSSLSLSSSVALASLYPWVGLWPPSNLFIHSLSLPVLSKKQLQEGVLSSCGCSLTLTLTTSVGIWHGAGATKSWSSFVSLSCSCRIYLCIRSNYVSGGWATRIIHFSLLVFSPVSITLIRQETISLAIRHYTFRLSIEGRLIFGDISSVVIRTKRVNLLHRLCTKPFIIEIETARYSTMIAEASS